MKFEKSKIVLILSVLSIVSFLSIYAIKGQNILIGDNLEGREELSVPISSIEEGNLIVQGVCLKVNDDKLKYA